MSKKSAKIAALIEFCTGSEWDPYYLGFFKCFNEGLYFEAHDVLEELWLRDRQGPNYSFHKGLIQLAGAFVHLQKNRLRPAVALYDLASNNFGKYPKAHEGIDLASVQELVSDWRSAVVDASFETNPLPLRTPPMLVLPRTGATAAFGPA